MKRRSLELQAAADSCKRAWADEEIDVSERGREEGKYFDEERSVSEKGSKSEKYFDAILSKESVFKEDTNAWKQETHREQFAEALMSKFRCPPKKAMGNGKAPPKLPQGKAG